MTCRSLSAALVPLLFCCPSAMAGDKPFPLFQVTLKSVKTPAKSATVELYSLGADGIFARVNGSTVGKVAIIESDPKFVFKHYRAGWDGQKFRFILRHNVRQSNNGKGVLATGWELTYGNAKYQAREPKVKLFPQAGKSKRKVLMLVTFEEKPGGMKLSDLELLLYPLPITPYDKPSDSVTYVEKDRVTGTRMSSARFSVTSPVPTEHVLAYLRGAILTNRISVASDTPVGKEK